MKRLHPSRLAALPAAVARPRYERGALRAGIVHLGAGAFMRAHLAVATEAALHASGDLHWGITGVSMRRADTRAALLAQHGLYALALRDTDADGAARERLQVIGAMPRVLVAPEDPNAVLEAIADAHTRIVSLTVTEKGYHHDPATGTLRFDDADIVHDLAHADAPRSTIGLLAHGLARRRERDLAPVTLLCCDNLPANGDTLRGLVLEFAHAVDPDLAEWIGGACSFPNSMVDRIVPRTTDADRERIAAALGVEDAWPVVAEPFFEWVIEDRFAAGRPDWSAGAVRFVADVEPFERLKLRMVNAGHSALAYLGVLAGHATVDGAVADPALRRFVDTMLRDEVAPTLPPLPGLDLGAWQAGLLRRFANPALRHLTRQIAMDGTQKLPQRLLGTVRDRLTANAGFERLGLAIAAWIQFLGGIDEQGGRYPIEDPLAEALAQQLAAAAQATDETASIRAFCGFAPVFGALGDEPRFVQTVARHAASLRDRGVRTTLDAMP